VLDEPINGLDPIQIVEMRDLILSLKGRHTVVLSSHILSEITKTCDRILVIDRGGLVAEGTEAALSGQGSNAMRLEVEFAGAAEPVLLGVKGLAGVSIVDSQAKGITTRLLLDLASDVRAEVARAIVTAGGDLVMLRKLDDGLEGLFLKLVQK
jgi:ABC-2 type transport system ATP-binding protein